MKVALASFVEVQESLLCVLCASVVGEASVLHHPGVRRGTEIAQKEKPGDV